jgi:hypothetical protein
MDYEVWVSMLKIGDIVHIRKVGSKTLIPVPVRSKNTSRIVAGAFSFSALTGKTVDGPSYVLVPNDAKTKKPRYLIQKLRRGGYVIKRRTSIEEVGRTWDHFEHFLVTDYPRAWTDDPEKARVYDSLPEAVLLRIKKDDDESNTATTDHRRNGH